MLLQRPVLFTHFKPIYRQYKPGSKEWITLPILMQILLSIAKSGVAALCVVDAMDESEDRKTAEEQSVTVLSQFSILVSNAPQSRMKFIVLSRPSFDIE